EFVHQQSAWHHERKAYKADHAQAHADLRRGQTEFGFTHDWHDIENASCTAEGCHQANKANEQQPFAPHQETNLLPERKLDSRCVFAGSAVRMFAGFRHELEGDDSDRKAMNGARPKWRGKSVASGQPATRDCAKPGC